MLGSQQGQQRPPDQPGASAAAGAAAGGYPYSGYSQKLAKEQAYAQLHPGNVEEHHPPPSYHMATSPSTSPLSAAAQPQQQQQQQKRTQQLRHKGRDRQVRDDTSSDQESFWEHAEREALRLEHGTPKPDSDSQYYASPGPLAPNRASYQDPQAYGPYATQSPPPHDAHYGSPSAPPPPSAYRAPPPGSREPQRPLPSPPQSATSHGSHGSYPPSPSPQSQGRPMSAPARSPPSRSPEQARPPPQAPSPTRVQQPHSPAPARPSHPPHLEHHSHEHEHEHEHPAAPTGPRHLMHAVPSAPHLTPEVLERDLPSLPHDSPSQFSGSLPLHGEEPYPRGEERYEPLQDEMRLTRGDHGRESSGETVKPGPGPGYDGEAYPSELTPLLPGGLRMLRAERDAREERPRAEFGRSEEEEEVAEEEGRAGRAQEEEQDGDDDDDRDEEDEPGMHDLPGERRPLQPPPRIGTPEPLTISPDTPDAPILLPNGNTKLLFRVVNPNRAPVAFKVMTTQPRVYSVRPNFGLIPPSGTLDLEVHAPADVASRRRPAPGRGDRFAVLSRFLAQEEEEELEEHEDFAALFPSKTTSAEGMRSQRFRIRPLMVPQNQNQGQGQNQGGQGMGSGMSATTAGSLMSAFSPSQRPRALSSSGSTTALSPTYTAAPLPSILGPATTTPAAPPGRPKSPSAIRFAPAVGAMASLAGVAGQFAEAREAERRDEVLRESIGAVREGVGELKDRLDEVIRRMQLEEEAKERALAPDQMPAEMEYSYPEYHTPGKKRAGLHPGRVLGLALAVFVATYYGRVFHVI
ncbi:hypothetical protein CALVIDRAFT_535431 [Calocera viscosa TUFC12733]|uniref:MSP domain-containing protein n=1 Tax=Calocera viscosa (strain TUFC12733) TaxID=1330018 RepID=A0A167P2N2_CALVF|nr:hypothetical protein CALVIDRAFT_535431 [Calocera viscosa TUFC12733]